MPSASTFLVFAIAAFGVLVIPGPAVLYIVTRSIHHGRAAGLVSVLGVATGSLVHVVAAALGMSALLMSSALAFRTVKLLGAAYLIWLGIRTLAGRDDDDVPEGSEAVQLSRAYGQGVVVNILNPKTALFFLAFLPQFVDPTTGAAAPQMLMLGAVFVALGCLSDGTYALVASRLGEWLRSRPTFARNRRYLSGGAYLTLGVAAALTGHRPRVV
jgi:threonine/homoserine/homoserine lactone efflux protein